MATARPGKPTPRIVPVEELRQAARIKIKQELRSKWLSNLSKEAKIRLPDFLSKGRPPLKESFLIKPKEFNSEIKQRIIFEKKKKTVNPTSLHPSARGALGALEAGRRLELRRQAEELRASLSPGTRRRLDELGLSGKSIGRQAGDWKTGKKKS